jgi:branched-chain amino acid transport system substrate-binding protein
MLAALSALLLLPLLAQAAEPLKIGMITTLSTPAGYLGEDIRDGFQIAIEQGKGTLGGVPVELVVADDAVNPDIAKELVTRMLQWDRISVFTGAVFSQTTLAIQPEIMRANGYFISSNTAPIELDGANCQPNYFIASWHNTGQFEAAAAAANGRGYKRMLMIAANVSGGREAVTYFRKNYQGPIVSEMLVKLNQTDFAAEISQLRALRPDALFTFLPGGMGVSFLRQLHQAGLPGIKLYSGMTVDTRLMQAVGDAAVGSVGVTFWHTDFDNPASRRFVEDFETRFKRPPTTYAAQGYESARLIASALQATGGKTGTQAFRAALRAAKFESVRGSFSFAPDQHPVQSWYETQIVKGPDGKPVMRTVRKLLADHRPPLADECKRAAAP